ncbi:hypothetical protein FEE96_06200 [Parasedimentitalea maritima]|uniref:Terminase small subunit n=1 Tax=Parasedimentitalea maritima TaxID=2578117 RepID=A0ABY2UWE4_9RHOB|nr:terminase small subunit [Zongyanglinia marina]TLP66942.1 hypothetical protein FEE96_06200 [Zongyanglinia marina]
MAKADYAKRHAFATAYAELGNASKAARFAGVPSTSAHSMGYKWLRDPHVASMIKEALDERLKSLSPTALQVIEQLMVCEMTPPHTRLQAARDVLDRLGWIPPKRQDAVMPTEQKDITELTRAELEALASGDPYIRLDDDALEFLHHSYQKHS